MRCNSPASPVRRGEAMSGGHRGKGAGWYIRLQAAKEIQGGMQCNSPASPVRRGGGRGRDGTLGNSRKGVKGKVCVAADPTKK